MASKPRFYWDACAWIGLIAQEPDKIDACRYIIELAQRGEVEVWTSAFTLAEVFKRKCDGEQKGLTEAQDVPFEDYLSQDYIKRAQVDVEVGTVARRLLRKFPDLGKPQDAVHLATAIIHNMDQFHTFDRENLLCLNGQIQRLDGKNLEICTPKRPDPPAEPDSPQISLFSPAKAADEKP